MSVIKEVVYKNFGTDDYSSKELTDYGGSKVYLISVLGGTYILRISSLLSPLENNYSALKAINSVLCPKPVILGSIGKSYYSFESFMSGEKRSYSEDNLKSLIHALMSLHSITSDSCGFLNSHSNSSWKDFFFSTFLDNKLRVFLTVNDSYKFLKPWIHENFPDTPRRFSLVHGDFSFTNSLFDSGMVRFFDFEDSFFGVKEYDLAMIYFMELLPENESLELFSDFGYDAKKILYFALCIGIHKFVTARDERQRSKRKKKLDMIIKKLRLE